MRCRNPLPRKTDSEVLRAAARKLLDIRRGAPIRSDLARDLAARLYSLARRVPLWTRHRSGGVTL